MPIDIVCFSHLRWNFVYQRPQHLMVRLSASSRVFFIEEPSYESGPGPEYSVSKEPSGNVFVIVPHLRPGVSPADTTKKMRAILNSLLESLEVRSYILWYYSPVMLSFSDHLTPVLTIYDCMDELSAFLFAPPELKESERALMHRADLVFTGGRSLYEAKKAMHSNIHLFPSSIDRKHFLAAREPHAEPDDQRKIPRPRFGFYGVIDERLDIEMLRSLAEQRQQWQFILIGPVVKIDPATLPRKSNIHYLGVKQYSQLPLYLGGWTIAMMPFALNASTTFISPTKTPEYLAGGKPVISPSIRDVVTSYGERGLVHIADTPAAFIEIAESILANNGEPAGWLDRVDSFLAGMSWDATVKEMQQLIGQAIFRKRTRREKSKVNTYTQIQIDQHVTGERLSSFRP